MRAKSKSRTHKDAHTRTLRHTFDFLGTRVPDSLHGWKLFCALLYFLVQKSADGSEAPDALEMDTLNRSPTMQTQVDLITTMTKKFQAKWST